MLYIIRVVIHAIMIHIKKYYTYLLPKLPLTPSIQVASKTLAENPKCTCLVLLKHGLFTWGATAEESYNMHIQAVSLVEQLISKTQHPALSIRPIVAPSKQFTDRVLTTLRGLFKEMSGNDKYWIVSQHVDAKQVFLFAQSEQVVEWSQMGTITPDHVIRTKAKPLVVRGLVESRFYSSHYDDLDAETPEGDAKLREYLETQLEGYCQQYFAYFEANNARVHGIKQMLDPLPRVLLVEHFGLITVGRGKKETQISGDIYTHTVPTLLSSMSLGNGKFEPASEADLFDCEYWSLEQAKLGKPSTQTRHGGLHYRGMFRHWTRHCEEVLGEWVSCVCGGYRGYSCGGGHEGTTSKLWPAYGAWPSGGCDHGAAGRAGV